VSTQVSNILKMKVPVIVRIGRRTMTLSEILQLGPGAIMELDRPSEQPLDVLINNKPIGAGSAVKIGENFGIRIESIQSAADRVAAMGPGSD